MPVYTEEIRQRVARAALAAEIDEERVLQVSRDLCAGWFAGLDLIHGDVPIGPLLEPPVATSVGGVYGVVRLLAQVRGAADQLLTENDGHEPWRAEALPHPADWLFVSLAEQRSGRTPPFCSSFPRGTANRVRLNGRLDGLAAVTDAPASPPAGGVLAVASVDRFLNPIAPVLRRLAGDTRVALVVPRAGREWQTVRSLGDDVRILFLEDLYTPGVAEVFGAWRARGERLWQTQQDALRERFTLDGVSLWEILQVGMEEVFLDLLPHVAAYIEMSHALCASEPPAVVLTAKLSEPLENALFAVAGQHRARRMLVMHGHVSPFPQHFFAQGRYHDADRVCLWGEYYREVLARHLGAAVANQTVVTGNPAWDELTLDARPTRTGAPDATSAALRERAATQLRAPIDGCWVTYLSDVISIRQYPLVQAAVAQVPGAFLIVNIHPGERPEEYQRQLLPELSGRAAVLPSGTPLPLHDLLRVSDVAATYSSTTALESILAGTPVLGVTLDPVLARRYPSVDWSDHGIPVARTLAELSRRLRELATDAAGRACLLAAEREGIRPFVGVPTGDGATGAVAREILAALQEVPHAR